MVYSEEVLRGIQAVLAEKEREFGSCILVISDEPYRELVYDGAMVPWIQALMPHAAVVYSYSKTLSLPGERIGWLLLPDSIPEARELYAAAVISNLRFCQCTFADAARAEADARLPRGLFGLRA